MHHDFYEEAHWLVSFLECSRYFAPALPDLVGYGATLYLESYEGRDELRPYLTKHRVPSDAIESVASARSERPAWTEHLLISEQLVADLESYYSQWYYTLADHIHCYRSGKTLLWFHDAFTGGELQIAANIPEERVARFCHAVAPTYRHVPSESDRNA